MKKINVLGTDYEIIEHEYLETCEGSCDKTTKEIKICKTLSEEPKSGEIRNMESLKQTIIRHEVIHALLFESGLAENCGDHNEQNVDWIAIMYPKMKKIFEELGV